MNNRWDGRYMGKFTSLLRKGNRSFTYWHVLKNKLYSLVLKV